MKNAVRNLNLSNDGDSVKHENTGYRSLKNGNKNSND